MKDPISKYYCHKIELKEVKFCPKEISGNKLVIDNADFFEDKNTSGGRRGQKLLGGKSGDELGGETERSSRGEGTNTLYCCRWDSIRNYKKIDSILNYFKKNFKSKTTSFSQNLLFHWSLGHMAE